MPNKIKFSKETKDPRFDFSTPINHPNDIIVNINSDRNIRIKLDEIEEKVIKLSNRLKNL